MKYSFASIARNGLSGTTIAKAMDKARGGHFRSVPDRYPDGAWYTYDDRTCDYGCQITEYIYWGLTSLLGAQGFPGRAEQIGNEWRLNTPTKLKAGDRLIGAAAHNDASVPAPDGLHRFADGRRACGAGGSRRHVRSSRP